MKTIIEQIHPPYGNIPAELRGPALWLQYYSSRDPKRPDKKPRKHPTVKYATPEDRAANLRPLDYLIANRQLAKGGGYQRYVDKTEAYVFIDIDKVRDPATGDVQPWAQDVIKTMNTYTEISPSGTGFRLVARGSLPHDYHPEGTQVEIYAGNTPNKLMAMTGDVYDLQLTIEDRQDQLNTLLQRAQAGEFGGKAEGTAATVEITSTKFSNIEEEALEWLWKDRIPKNKIVIFGGNPDAGKSLQSIDLIACLTTGRKFADGARNEIGPIEAAMLFCEDDANDTVKPRLLAAGADCDKVYRLNGTYITKDGSKRDRHIAFDTDLPMLEKFLLANRAVRFLVIDPISSYLGEASMVKETDVRRVLVPLAELAARLEVTVLLIAHLNKRSDVTALNKIMGAVALSGVARAAWMFAADPEDEESYLMVRGKLNVGKKTEGLRYSIQSKPVPKCGDQPYIKWEGTTEISAGKALGLFDHLDEGKGKKTRSAEEWLQGYLAAGCKPSDDVYVAAERHGFKERTLERAKAALGVKSIKSGGEWHWQLSGTGQGRQTEDELHAIV